MSEWVVVTVIGMFLACIAYILTLYHQAHGNERKAVAQGAKIVLDALKADGKLMADDIVHAEPFNMGEEEYQIVKEPELSPVIIARNQKAAEQIGDRVVDDLMRVMDEKI